MIGNIDHLERLDLAIKVKAKHLLCYFSKLKYVNNNICHITDILSNNITCFKTVPYF